MSPVAQFAIELIKLIMAVAPEVIDAIAAIKSGNNNGTPLHKQVQAILDPALKDLEDANEIFKAFPEQAK